MRNPGRLLAVLLAAALAAAPGCASAATDTAAADAAGFATIHAKDLRVAVAELASDALEGRETGSEGGALAAAWLGLRFGEAGLEGGGEIPGADLDAGMARRVGLDGGPFFQRTDTLGWKQDGPPLLAVVGAAGAETPLRSADEDRAAPEYFVARPGLLETTLDLVVARTAEEIPPPRADAALLLLAHARERRAMLEQAGAPDGRGWGLLLLHVAALDRPPRTAADGAHVAARAGPGSPPPIVVLVGAAGDRLASGEVERVRVAMRGRDVRPAYNVVAVLPGAGAPGRPGLADEAIVLSAHYDHIGVSSAPATEPPPAGEPGAGEPDLINNGADDDASGVAAVLELAEAFAARAAAGAPPARTLVFLLATGEEHGLLGTDYYIEHPAVPLARTVANVNFEMIGRPDPLAGGAGRLWLTGFELTNLGPAWAEAGLPIVPDARPEQRFFERSDNIAFVRRGVVGQTLSSYAMHEDYHTPRDEADRLDYEHMEDAVRAAYRALLPLADGALDPAWTPSR